MVKLLTTKSPDAVRAFLLPRVLGNGIAIAPAAREEVKAVVCGQDLEKGILVIPTCDFPLRIASENAHFSASSIHAEPAKTRR